MKELLLFEPLCKERIWGSETWTVSALPEGDLKVSEGSLAGETLSGLWKDHRELFGRGKGELFPLLVKVIDAKADLSIQVHPDDTYAKAHENRAFGKAESWYIMDVTEGNTLVLGHHAKTREQAREMVQSGRWNEFIRQVPVEAGELVQIDPGTIHAIHGGTKITEIQQSSDITYRLYDYDRTVNGKKRELHIEKSLDVIRVPDRSEEKIYHSFPKNGHQTAFYQIMRYEIEKEQSFDQDKDFQIISVVNGEGHIDGHRIKRGDSLIVPYAYGNYTITGQTEILITSL